MRLKEYLNELSMKSDTQLEVKKGKNYVDAGITTTAGDEFNLTIDKGSWIFYDRDVEEWEIAFTDDTGTIKTSPKSPKTAIELFAAIEKVVKDFIIKYKPEAIRFSGLGESKDKLYSMLSKRIVKSGKYINIDPSAVNLFQLVRKDILKSQGWKV